MPRPSPRYDAIWHPYYLFCRNFIRLNPRSDRNFFALIQKLHRYESLLHSKDVRNHPRIEEINWVQSTRKRQEKLIYSQNRLAGRDVVLPSLGFSEIWTSMLSSYLVNIMRDDRTMFVDVGTGIGLRLFGLHLRCLDGQHQFVGIDESTDGIRCARLLADYGGCDNFTFHEANIANGHLPTIRAEGRNVTFFSSSVLNKIQYLPVDFFKNMRDSVEDAGQIDFLFLETTGWQFFFDDANRQFARDLGPKMHGLPDEIDTDISNQKRRNFDLQDYNRNMVETIRIAQQNKQITVYNIFINYMGVVKDEQYSIFHLRATG